MKWTLEKPFIAFLGLMLALSCGATELKPNPPAPGYEHNKWGVTPQDLMFDFTAFMLSFDGNSDGEAWGIPRWVAYEIKHLDGPDHPSERPSPWITDKALFQQGICPADETYAVSGTQELSEVETDFRYVRGHMCPKNTGERISSDAAFNTHITLNAVPQLQWQNAGIWESLESHCEDWADEHGRIWVVCGPVFFAKNPSVWLGQKGEVRAAVPDALYKIVIRQDENDHLSSLAFVIPNVMPPNNENFGGFLTSIDRIESLTGLNFLSNLPEAEQSAVEQRTATSTDDW